MELFIDADGCPVTDLAVRLAGQYHIPCTIFCDTAHRIERDGAATVTVSKGADSVDFALVNRVCTGDLVITQDYGLASMCLAKRARVMHQDGWLYTEYNISGLLEQRHAARRFRAAGGRTKGPSKRTQAQNDGFAKAFRDLLQQAVQG